MRLVIGLLLSVVFLASTSCFTPKKEKEIKDEITDVKTRLGDLERSTNEKGQTNETTSRRNIASTQTELERINLEINRIKGDLEALKVAVKTGELPGSDPEGESVAKKLNELNTRIQALESNGVAAAKSAPVTTAAAAKEEASGESKKVSVTELRNAFNNKKFAFVAANADGVISRVKTKGTREEVAYYGAESLFRLNRYREAALKFNDFTDQFSSSARVAHAKMRLGDAFNKLGDSSAAKSFYKEIISKYPRSEEASKAKEALDALEAKGASNQGKSNKTKYSTGHHPKPHTPKKG